MAAPRMKMMQILQPFAVKMAVARIFVELGKWLKSDQILHLPLCTTSSTAGAPVFFLEIEPRGFSYYMTSNLALNSGCDGWRARRSHMTNLSVHSLAFHLPGYHAGSKSTQKSAAYIPSNILLKWTKDRVRRREVFVGTTTRSEIWLEGSFERARFGCSSSMCTSYALSCDLPWNEMSILSG